MKGNFCEQKFPFIHNPHPCKKRFSLHLADGRREQGMRTLK